MRADEVFYDVSRNTAVAVSADLTLSIPKTPEPIHLRADELEQTSQTTFTVKNGTASSSKTPNDPDVQIFFKTADVETIRRPRRSIFGLGVTDNVTGQPLQEENLYYQARNAFLEIDDTPVFYFPYLAGDARHPLGPLESISLGFNRIFGFQFNASLDVYQLLGYDDLPGTHWRFNVDYMSKRGPGAGTDVDYVGKDPFGIPSRYIGFVKAWGLEDTGQDDLGGGRGTNDNHPEWRGRFTWRQSWWDLPGGFQIQNQLFALSDHNFLEQFYKYEYDTDINQETFVYAKQQQDNWAWTALVEPHIRTWVTETEWLPRADGWLIGQSFFDLFVYTTHASAGYAQLIPSTAAPEPTAAPPIQAPPNTLVRLNTARFDWMQELSMPFQLGPVKFVPYGRLDLTEYTEDLEDQSRGRFYGAGGVSASMPLTRIYPDIQSELWNLNGINHKIVFSTNFYIAHSDTPFEILPQLDQLQDNASQQALRDITPIQQQINLPHGLALQTNPLYNYQVFAIRSLTLNSIDTEDSIEEIQFDIRQRWQTKRGYPGYQHIVDWMTLDLSGTFFPHPTQDNFGGTWAFMQYDWTWNIGDRTTLVSTGWTDPLPGGVNMWTVGAYFNRPDRTNFFLGYRQIDVLQSKAVTAAVTYIFSPKYAFTGSSTYDFGTSESLSNTLTLTRIGTDVQVSLGITYNALQNNFGLIFQIVPNLIPNAARLPGTSLLTPPTVPH